MIIYRRVPIPIITNDVNVTALPHRFLNTFRDTRVCVHITMLFSFEESVLATRFSSSFSMPSNAIIDYPFSCTVLSLCEHIAGKTDATDLGAGFGFVFYVGGREECG